MSIAKQSWHVPDFDSDHFTQRNMPVVFLIFENQVYRFKRYLDFAKNKLKNKPSNWIYFDWTDKSTWVTCIGSARRKYILGWMLEKH